MGNLARYSSIQIYSTAQQQHNFLLQILDYEKHEITKLQTRLNGISIKLNGNNRKR
jgi:hypothetical protein